MKEPEPQQNPDQRVLILAPTGRDGTLTARFLQDENLRAEVCVEIEEVCRKMLDGAGLVFLTGEALTVETMRCLMGALEKQPAWSDIPLVVLTSGGGGTPSNMAALAKLVETGNVTLIERPVRVLTLVSTIKSALRARRRQYEVRDRLAAERRAQEALRQSEERLRIALDAGRLGAWQLDLHTGRFECTPLCKANFGLPAEAEFTYERFSAIIHPDDRAMVRAEIDRALRERDLYRAEYRVVWADGSLHWILANGRGNYDADGQAYSMVGVTLDITDRRRAEEVVRESERQLRLLANAISQLAWMAEPDGHIFWYNQRWYDYTGTTPEQMEGWGWQTVHDPELLPTVLERWRASLQTSEAFEMEFPLKGADGTFRSFLTRAIPLKDAAGRVLRWFGTNTDVEELRQALREAEEASRLKDEFLATVSHELRTPLTAVLGWTHLLRTGRLDEQAAAHALATVERNARSQNQLIEDLLDVSRIITGKLRLDVRPTDPAAFIESAVGAVLPAAEAKEIRLQKVLDTGVSAISGDPARLQQVVWNLLSNAIKFTPRGGRVQVRLERVASHLEISVSDTGDGIKAEFLPYVFDRFRQGDGSTTRRHGGLGLGLSIVRHLVELHGGTVEVESEGEGQGATFTVKLPLLPIYQRQPDAERVHPTAPDHHRALEYADKLDGLKVLVVDDERDTLELVSVLLGQCGAEVTTAHSVSRALGQLPRLMPDVIISDIGMPGEDGFEFIRRVRELPPELGGRIPAVALTAYARAEDRVRVLRSGYQMHVPKPVELAELVTIVANVVGRV